MVDITITICSNEDCPLAKECGRSLVNNKDKINPDWLSCIKLEPHYCCDSFMPLDGCAEFEATLRFNLDTHRTDFMWALNGYKYWNTLWELMNAIRQKVKYENNPQATWDDFQDKFYEVLNESGIDLFDEA